MIFILTVAATAACPTATLAEIISLPLVSEGRAELLFGGTVPGFTPWTPGMVPYLGFGYNPSQASEAALLFDISRPSTIPLEAEITSASLTLHVAGSQARFDSIGMAVSGFPEDGVVLRAENFFGETPTTLLGRKDGLPLNAAPGFVDIPFTLDITTFIRSLDRAGVRCAGVLLDAGSTGAFVYASGATDPATRPQLTVAFAAPEPRGLVLAGLASATVLVASRRRVQRPGPMSPAS